MTKLYDIDLHHLPRKKDKKKHHQKGFNEDSLPEQRATRVGFKQYMRQVDEAFLEEEFNDSGE